MGLLSSLMGNAGTVSNADLNNDYGNLLFDGENIEMGFKLIRDTFIFTNKRLILADVQGITGNKVEYMSIAYKSISKFSVETAGTFDLDAELKIWISSEAMPSITKKFNKSGNGIFESEISDIKLLENKIKKLIFSIYSFEVDIFITTKDVIESAINNIPFIGNEFEIKSIYIGFMINDYDKENYSKLQSQDFGVEKFDVINNILYFYIPKGQQKSKFSNNFFENKLKTIITTRNVNTCQKLIELSK